MRISGILVALWIVGLSAQAASPALDFLVSFTGGANGAVITTNIITTSTHTSLTSGWISDPPNSPWGTTNIFLCNSPLFTFPGGYTVGGTTYTGGSQSARYDFTCESFWNYWFEEDFSTVTGFFFFMLDVPPGDNVGFDVFTMQSWDGGYGLIQWYNSNPPYIHPHNAGATQLPVSSGTPYYCTFRWVTEGNFDLTLYNATTWVKIGEIANTTSILTHGASVFSLGCNPHGYESGTYHLYFGDWGMTFADIYPIIPSSHPPSASPARWLPFMFK